MPKSSRARRSTQGLEVGEHGHGPGGVVDEDAFGHLQDQGGGVHAGLVQDGGDGPGEAGVHQLAGGDVDRQVQRRAGVLAQPGAAVAAGAFEDPGTDLR